MRDQQGLSWFRECADPPGIPRIRRRKTGARGEGKLEKQDRGRDLRSKIKVGGRAIFGADFQSKIEVRGRNLFRGEVQDRKGLRFGKGHKIKGRGSE